MCIKSKRVWRPLGSISLITMVMGIVGAYPLVRAAPITLHFSGPLKQRETNPEATYHNVQLGENMQGKFTIGATANEGSFIPPNLFLFHPNIYFGVVTGNDIETSSQNSNRPLEITFENNSTFEQEDIDFLNQNFATNFQAGSTFDVVSIETDITNGDRRIEFGVNFIFSDTQYLTDSSYRAFPALEDADLAIYFIVEEQSDNTIYSATGQITEFGPQLPSIGVQEAIISNQILTLTFRATPNVTGWKVKGDTDLDSNFSDDLTTSSTITQSAEAPGTYTAQIDLTDSEPNYFLRIED